MKKALCLVIALVMAFGCFASVRTPVSAAAESWDVEFTVSVNGYNEQPASAKVIIFTNDTDSERVIRTNEFDFKSSVRVFIFNSEGRMTEAGENLLPDTYSCQNALIIPAHGFMAAFGSSASSKLHTAYNVVFEGAVLYNSTMSIICEAYGSYDRSANTFTLKYNRPASPGENCISFLFVGNSSTYFNGTPLKFKALCREAGIEVSVTYCTFGSAYLSEFADETHERGKALRSKLSARKYDYVVLQEAAKDNYSSMKAALDVILPLVEANGAKPLLYMRYSDSTEGCIRHYQIYTRISEHYGIPYSPVCVAFEYCRTDHPEINLYASDGGHHSKAGSYIAAATWLYSFFGVSPVGNAYTADMPQKTVDILQQYAAKAVETVYAAGEVGSDDIVKNGFTYKNVALDKPYTPVGDVYSGNWTDTAADGTPIGKFTDGEMTTEGDSHSCGCYKNRDMTVTIDLGKTYSLIKFDTDLFGNTWGIPDPENGNVVFEVSTDGVNFTEVAAPDRSTDKSYKEWTRVYFYSEPEQSVTARYVRVIYQLDREYKNTFCWVSEIRAFGVIRGDMNGDSKLNSDDAIYLLRYTLFGGEYAVSQGADIDCDGSVSSDDAIYLLRHTLFGDDYPLK